MTARPLVEVARQVLTSWPYGVLGTAVGDRPKARLVQHLCVDDDLSVWIGTSPRSRKVATLEVAPAATYTVEDRDRFAYVTLSGSASVVRDAASAAAHWTEDLRPFFPAGPQGDDFVLVRLKPETVELMSFADGVHPPPYGLVPAVLKHAPATEWVLERPVPG